MTEIKISKGCSGLLFYGFMKRAILLRKKEEGSALRDCSAESFFASSDDSVLVCRVWESSFDEKVWEDEKLKALREAVSDDAFAELQEIAGLLMHRLHITLSNAIIATAVKMNCGSGNGG